MFQTKMCSMAPLKPSPPMSCQTTWPNSTEPTTAANTPHS